MAEGRLSRLGLLLLMLLGLAFSLCACRSVDPLAGAAVTAAPGEEPVLPDAPDSEPARQRLESALWFRYGDEPLLSAEWRVLSTSPSQSYELALVSALITGPSAGRSELRSLFPPGTRVLSTTRQGRLLFVTLSAEVLNQYPDEPVDWREYDTWLVESPLRRRLAMQSIVATVTENCDIDAVQILVARENTVGSSLRLKQNYFLDDSEDDVLTGPLTREEALLLTPGNTLDTALNCWSRRDWRRLYRYVAARDASTGLSRPSYEAFVLRMETLPGLVSFQRSGGAVSPSGDILTFTVDSRLSRGGQAEERTGRVVRVRRESGLWKISVGDLAALAE